jgi:hypothetical protein
MLRSHNISTPPSTEYDSVTYHFNHIPNISIHRRTLRAAWWSPVRAKRSRCMWAGQMQSTGMSLFVQTAVGGGSQCVQIGEMRAGKEVAGQEREPSSRLNDLGLATTSNSIGLFASTFRITTASQLLSHLYHMRDAEMRVQSNSNGIKQHKRYSLGRIPDRWLSARHRRLARNSEPRERFQC